MENSSCSYAADRALYKAMHGSNSHISYSTDLFEALLLWKA